MRLAFLLSAADRVVTYVRVKKPELDMVSVILGAFTITGLLVALALVAGVTFGVCLILRRRREKPFLPGAGMDLTERAASHES